MWELLFIFFAEIIDVSLNTIRMILVIRGSRWPAALVGFFEILLYIIALGLVVNALDNTVKLLVYCSGFALGIVFGSYIEEHLSLGYRGLQVIIDKEKFSIIEDLRNDGFPVTCWEGNGKCGPKSILTIVVRAKLANYVADKIYSIDPTAFVIFMEPKQFRGGYIIKNRY